MAEVPLNHTMRTGLYNHATNPISPLTAYINNIITAKATALSWLSPSWAKRSINTASLVPIPEMDIGISVITAVIETHATKKKKGI